MKILFVCTHNACRSVLAEVIARKLGEGRIETASAGSNPAGRIHPLTLEYLGSEGHATEGLASQSFADVEAFAPDAVITVCDRAAKESCPVWLGEAVKAHWGLPDPSHLEGSEKDRAEAFDEVAATLANRIKRLLVEDFEQLDDAELAELLDRLGELH